MKEEMKLLMKQLDDNNYSCIVESEDKKIITSNKKGVAPLLDLYNQGYKNLLAVDKVVGKGAAVIHILLNTKVLYTHVISKKAKEILVKYNKEFYYDKEVEYILNNKKDGMCPIEKAVYDTEEVDIAYKQILQKLSELNFKK